MGLTVDAKFYTTDTAEQREKCLSCLRGRCYDCLGYSSKRPHKYDKTKFAELYEQGKSDKEIADEVGCKAATVWTWRRRRGLAANRRERSGAGQELDKRRL